jgi:hypothetical protein
MQTPIGERTLEFILRSLATLSDSEHQYKLLEFLKRTTLLYSNQAEKIIEQLNLQNDQGRLLNVISFALIYEMIIDKENFIPIVERKFDRDHELKQFETLTFLTKDNNTKIPSGLENFERENLEKNPNFYIDNFARVKNQKLLNTNENQRKDLIPLEDFYEFIKETYYCFEDKTDFRKKLKKKFEKFYICTNNVMDMINNSKRKVVMEYKIDLILDTYEYLIDPQNVERLINNIGDAYNEIKLRDKLAISRNYYFGLKKENNESRGCCCVIF